MNNVIMELKIAGYTEEDTERAKEIFHALISCGGLSGVKAGKTIIHFDKDAIFQGVQLDYWPFRKRN